MNLEDIMLSEVSQSQKDKYNMIPLIEVFKVAKHLEAESRMVVARSWEQVKMGNCCSMSVKFQLCKMNNV